MSNNIGFINGWMQIGDEVVPVQNISVDFLDSGTVVWRVPVDLVPGKRYFIEADVNTEAFTSETLATVFDTWTVQLHECAENLTRVLDALGPPLENEQLSIDSAVTTFELEKTEYCWRDDCGGISDDASETGLCGDHLKELRGRWTR